MSLIGRAESAFVTVNRVLIGAMMVLMFVFVFTNVVTRYSFGFSISWAEELSRFLMIWTTYLGAGLALREGRHVSIEVFEDRLSPRARTVLRSLLAAVILTFCLVLVYYGIHFSVFGWNKETEVLQIPRGLPYLAIPIGLGFFAVHLAFFLRRFVARDWDRKDMIPDDVDEDALADVVGGGTPDGGQERASETGARR